MVLAHFLRGVAPSPSHWKIMKNFTPSWKTYERVVATLLRNSIDTNLCVTMNARVAGIISKRSRQIDVLIESRHQLDSSRRIIVDAKRRSRKIDVTHVESLHGLMVDAGATHGYLVCPMGFSEAAQRRAQESITICLVSLDHIPDFDPNTWPLCQNPMCKTGRVFWDGFPNLYASLQNMDSVGASVEQLNCVHYVGKCDRCGGFHVTCLTCGDLFYLNENEGEHQCGCRFPWFWLACAEEIVSGELSAELVLVLGTGQVIPVNRRPIVATHE